MRKEGQSEQDKSNYAECKARHKSTNGFSEAGLYRGNNAYPYMMMRASLGPLGFGQFGSIYPLLDILYERFRNNSFTGLGTMFEGNQGMEIKKS
jgi:hypothetical protein